MKTQPATQLGAVLCALALASCVHPPDSQKLQVSGSLRPDLSASGRVFQEVNSYRASQGARPVERHSGLDRLAQQHCEYLRQHRGTFSLSGKNVSHFGFEGRALAARELYQMPHISENVAAAKCGNSDAPGVIVGLWRNSRDHHKNMLDKWTHSGVGVVVDSDGTVFATQLFSTVSANSPMSMMQRLNGF